MTIYIHVADPRRAEAPAIAKHGPLHQKGETTMYRMILAGAIAALVSGGSTAQTSTGPIPETSGAMRSSAAQNGLCTDGQMERETNGEVRDCRVGAWRQLLTVHMTIFNGQNVLLDRQTEVVNGGEVKLAGAIANDKTLSYTLSLHPQLAPSAGSDSLSVQVDLKLSKLVSTRTVKSGNASLPISSYKTCSVLDSTGLTLGVAKIMSSIPDSQPSAAFNGAVGADAGLPGCSIKVEISRAAVRALPK